MFLDLPSTVVKSTHDLVVMTEGAMHLPIEYLRKDITSTIREQVLDFGHGQFTLRQIHHGANVPLDNRGIAA